MAALIAWMCRLDHRDPARRDDAPNLTLYGGKWAYCPHGGDTDHKWEAIEPAPFEMLRLGHHRSAGVATEAARTE